MITLKFINNYQTPQTIYFRYYNDDCSSCLTDQDGKNVPGGNRVYTMNIAPKKIYNLQLKKGNLKSAIAWLDTAQGRSWQKPPPPTDIDGPHCSSIEFTIDDNVVSYDITAVEGLCGSYFIKWEPDSGKGLSINNVVCNPKKSGQFTGNFIPSDKNNSKLSDRQRALAGCGEDQFSVPDGKIKCRQFMNSFSYNHKPLGYCRWLYDNNCQGYCWAYDEMRCPDGKTCEYDKNGNPTINGIVQNKTVNGRPTNPQPPREPGTLTFCFGPLGEGGCKLSPSPPPSPTYYKCVQDTDSLLAKNNGKKRNYIFSIILLTILACLIPIILLKGNKYKYLLIGADLFVIVIIAIFTFIGKSKYYKCDANGNCIEDTTGGKDNKDDPTCGGKCIPPSPPPAPSKYYKCDGTNCIEDTTGGKDHKDDPTCAGKCKPAPPAYYKCDFNSCILDTTGGTQHPNDPTCGGKCTGYKCVIDPTGKNNKNDPTCGGYCTPNPAPPPPPSSSNYKIVDNWTGKDIKTSLDNNQDWEYFTQGDPTSGSVDYSNWPLITTNGNSIKISVGGISPNHANLRKAIRINTTKTYNNGLFIMKATHIPAGLPTWPSWWLTAQNNWACGGEIDIIEGANADKTNPGDTWKNRSSLHISPPGSDPTNICVQTAPITGQCGIVDSGLAKGGNCKGCGNGGPCPYVGCGQTIDNQQSFGAGFNKNGGGVYACLLENDQVTVWFFTNDMIPDMDNPEPEKWNVKNKVAFQKCAAGQFNNLVMIINTTLCGTWAGNTFPVDKVDPKYKGNNNWSTCNNFVADPAQTLDESYWEIDWIKIFQKK